MVKARADIFSHFTVCECRLRRLERLSVGFGEGGNMSLPHSIYTRDN